MDASFMEAVANYGLAIVIAGYLVWWVTNKLNSKLDRLTQSIENLNQTIQHLIEEVRK